MGESVKLVAKGLKTGRVHDPILNAAQIAQLTVSPSTPSAIKDQRIRASAGRALGTFRSTSNSWQAQTL